MNRTNDLSFMRKHDCNNCKSRVTIKKSIICGIVGAYRVFKLLLRPDHSLFAEDVEFEGEKGRKIDFDPGTAYIGTLEGIFIQKPSLIFFFCIICWTCDVTRD